MVNQQNKALRLAAMCDAEIVDTVRRDILMHETAVELRRLHHEREELINALRCIAGTSAQAAGTGDHWVHWVDQAKAAITKVVDAS